MGQNDAIITKNMYDEAKRYVLTVLQAGVPLVDADYNDQMVSLFTQLRRVVQTSLGDGAVGDAFKIQQYLLDPVNNFKITGGETPTTSLITIDATGKVTALPQPGPEGLFNKGHHAELWSDETYKVGPETSSISTNLTQTAFPVDTLEDSAAQFVPGALVGLTLVPDINVPANQYPIVANTVNTIQANGTMVATVGQNYRVMLTTPVANRKDLVYLDCYLNEISPEEDPDLYHQIDSMLIEAMFRKKIVQTVLVTEGITLPLSLPTGWTDADGNPHVIVPLALIDRPAGNANITDSMITDLRRKIFRLDEIDDRFVNVTGDTMTGALVMEANIIMDIGRKVLGTCIIDGDALCEDIVEQKHMKRDSHLLGSGDAIPTWSQVNNPLDPNHFKVHDNRYYEKSVLDAMIGANLISNGLFDDGLVGWENLAPKPLYGYPPIEADKAIVSISLCGATCEGGFCSCRSLQVYIPAGNRVCTVCAVRQEVCGGIKCGGEFMLIHTICVTKGEEAVIPYLVFDLYSSCQYVGTRAYQMWEPSLDQPTKQGIDKYDGFVRMEKKIELPKCIDNAVVTLCYQIIPLRELLPPPPPVTCDTCRQVDPLNEGTGAVGFCVESPVQLTPFTICRYFDPPQAVLTDVSFALQSNRVGAAFDVILYDQDGKRAVKSDVATGGLDLFTIPVGDFAQPDGAVDYNNIVTWCISWTDPQPYDENATDNWQIDSALAEGWDDVDALIAAGDAACGYFGEPEPPPEEPPAPPEQPEQEEPASACEVGPDPFEISACAVQMRRISGPEGEIDPGVGCKTNKIPVITNVYLDGTVEFTPAFNQVQTVLEVLEEECSGPE